MKDWQWQEVHASRAAAENVAVKIMQVMNTHEPLRLLRNVRGKRILAGFRRYDLKFETFQLHKKALVRVDLSKQGYYWCPIRALCLYPAPLEQAHLLFVFDLFGGELRLVRDLEREQSYGPLKGALLSDPIPRGFGL